VYVGLTDPRLDPPEASSVRGTRMRKRVKPSGIDLHGHDVSRIKRGAKRSFTQTS